MAQPIERRILVGIRIGRRGHGHVCNRVERTTASDDHLADPDNFRGDVADAMDSERRSVLSLKNQLQQPTPAGNGASRRVSEIRPPAFLIKRLFPAFLLRPPY